MTAERAKRPSGAFWALQRRLYDRALDDAVELGAMSPGLAQHFRQFGFRRDVLAAYTNGLRGQRRRLEPDERELDKVEARLRRMMNGEDE